MSGNPSPPPLRRRACPFCEGLQLWSPGLGEWFHSDTIEKHCDEERLAYFDSAKLHRELGRQDP